MASNSKSLEEMLASEVDESAISALVGSLGTELERPMTQDCNHSTLNSVNHSTKQQLLQNDSIITNTNTNQTINSVNNSIITAINSTNSDSNNKRIIINNNTNNNNNNNNNNNILINSNSNININNSQNSNNNNNNKLMPQTMSSTTSGPLPGALPASGYISQVTNSSTVPLNAVNSGIPANQILQNAIKVSAMPNGSPNSSPLQQTLQQTAQQLSTTRPSTTIALSAITPSLVITQNKTTAGGKPGQTLLIATTKDGPMIVQPSNNPIQQQNTSNTNSNESSTHTTTGVSVPTTSTVVTIASRNIVSSANSSGQQNLMHHLMNSNSNPIQFQLVTNVSPSRPQTNANIGAQKQLAPRVVQLSPNVRLTPQVIRPGTSQGFTGQGTITLPSNLVRAGTIFVKTENGQVHMVNVAPQHLTQSSNAATPPPTTYRLQVPATATAQNTVRNIGNQHIVLPVSMANALQNKSAQQSPSVQVSQPLTIQTTAANAQAATTPSQMSPNTAKKKCKNFLSTLIRLASDQPDQVANNVKNLIQGLIDDAIQPEDFTNQLQKELNSSPQPCLVPFLRKSLPYLRYSLMQKELTIEGVRPPPHGAVSLPPQSQAIPQIQIAQTPRQGITPTVRLLTQPLSNLMGGQPATVLTSFPSTPARLPTPQNIIRTPIAQTTASRPTSKSTSSKSRAPAAKDKEKKSNFSSSLRDDDDINDVAAMGGVNLQEESQRILASNAEIVGQQIRSCKDENFLFTTPLHTRINKIASKFGLEECPPDVVSLVSHAVQERLKTLVEKLGVIAEHRQEQLKNDPKYEVLQDVKGQVQFLQELDRIEKRKHEELEREVLIKAAKSRSKADDPDHLAIKMRAKEMQRQEMEELRQKEANETALQAIGNPKKRLKNSFNSITPSVSNTFGGSSSSTGLNSSPFSNTPLKPMRRIKRVGIRDLHFLMEQEKETVRTPMLYRAYAK